MSDFAILLLTLPLGIIIFIMRYLDNERTTLYPSNTQESTKTPQGENE
jgi:hypothetical protein